MFAFFVKGGSKFEKERLQLLPKEINILFNTKKVMFLTTKMQKNSKVCMNVNKAQIIGFLKCHKRTLIFTFV
jgi:hypothetical protein